MRAPSPHTGTSCGRASGGGECQVYSRGWYGAGRPAAGPYLFNKARPAALVGPFLTK